jgi:hypothetical protein
MCIHPIARVHVKGCILIYLQFCQARRCVPDELHRPQCFNSRISHRLLCVKDLVTQGRHDNQAALEIGVSSAPISQAYARNLAVTIQCHAAIIPADTWKISRGENSVTRMHMRVQDLCILAQEHTCTLSPGLVMG